SSWWALNPTAFSCNHFAPSCARSSGMSFLGGSSAATGSPRSSPQSATHTAKPTSRAMGGLSTRPPARNRLHSGTPRPRQPRPGAPPSRTPRCVMASSTPTRLASPSGSGEGEGGPLQGVGGLAHVHRPLVLGTRDDLELAAEAVRQFGDLARVAVHFQLGLAQ